MKYTEARVTKSIIKSLIDEEWKIIAYDFPQSGTGIVIHPNEVFRTKTKNKDSFIPDIICTRKNIALFFENKDRFYLNDFIKLENIRRNNIYSDDINKILGDCDFQIYYGIGIPKDEKIITKSLIHSKKVDFIVASDLLEISVVYDSSKQIVGKDVKSRYRLN